MSLQVKYLDIPEGAQDAAVVSAASGQLFGAPQQIAEGAADIPWATLEPGGWMLDGTQKLLPDAPEEIGWWSAVRSGEDGRFADPPTITISFPDPYTATGLSFLFWPSLNQWCSEVQVRWYRKEMRLADVIAYPDGANWTLPETVESFDRIEIRLLETNLPGQFAKLQQVQIGQVVVFLQDEIIRVRLLNEVDPSMCELSVDTMTVEIRDKKNRNLLPQKNQRLELRRGGERIATQYITDSSRENREQYVFTCQSAVGRLESEFAGGEYRQQDVKELLSQVLSGFPYELDASFADMTVTGNLPICTCRDALQQIAFAIGAVVLTQGDGKIRLVPPEEAVTGVFEPDSIFTGANLTREARTAGIQITYHNYQPDGEDLPNTATRLDTNVNAAEKGNIVVVENATLVDYDNVHRILQRLTDYHKLKHVLTEDVVVSGQRAGQIVRSPNPWGTVTEGYITGMDSEFTRSGHTASITIRGREVDSL